MGFFGKVFSRTVLVILLTAGLVYFASLRALEEQVYVETGARVERESRLVASTLSRLWDESREGHDAALLEELSQDLGGSRLTLIALDGEVLYDNRGEEAGMDNHLQREEVRRPGELVTRFSATMREEMLYVAQPIVRDGRTVAYARISQSVVDADAQLAALNTAVRYGVLLAILGALLLAALIARQISRPLRLIGEFVAEVGRGETGRRIPIMPGPEIAQLAQTVNTMTDALEEKIARIQRDKAEREAILSAIADGLIALDVEQRMLFINGPARRMVRAPAGRVKGLAISEVTENSDIAALLEKSEEQAGVVHARTVLPGAEGERRLELSAVPLPGEGERRRGSVLVLRDVTELRHLEAVRRDFVSNVSHELKTPLTAMRGYVDAILDDEDMPGGMRQTFLEKARQNTERLTAIVTDLLSLSRLESEERDLSLEPLEVGEVIEEVIEESQDLALSRQVRLAREGDGSNPCANADAQALHMAISNLVSNAIQYSPQDTGEVIVRLTSTSDELYIDVIDNGPGIPADEQERIFERFYRVDKARSRRLGGTGLGLSIVRHVMAAHDGKVELESREGEGARFRLVLPRAQ